MTGWWSTAAGAMVIATTLAVVTSAAETERHVTVRNVKLDQAVVVRSNGAASLIKIGAGCPSLRRYEGRQVVVSAPALFLGAGSRLMIPDLDQQCRIWSTTPIESVSGGVQ